MAGSSTADAPAFFFDVASPEAYLSAERILSLMPVPCEWIPVLSADLAAPERWDAFRCAEERDIARARVERAAAERGLQPFRWPDPFPFDSSLAMRAATYAKGLGKTVAYALAAFRQAFAGGRALEDADGVVVAAAACEMHPAAVLKALELRSVVETLDAATADAAQRGVRDVPAVWTPSGRVFHGDDELPRAARALA